MYSYHSNIDAKLHDEFVQNSPLVNLFQSSKWAEIKHNWKNERLGFFKDGKLVAVASILIRPLPLGFTIIYIPRGPIMDYSDSELVHYVLNTLKKVAKHHKAIFITFDPSLLIKQSLLDQEGDEVPETTKQLNIIQEAGAIWSGRTTSMDETIQPRFQANINKNDFSIDNLSKKVRQEIRTAQNKGLTIRTGGLELLPQFSLLMSKTAQRKQIGLRNKDYYHLLLTTYKENAHILLASLDLKKQEMDLQEKLDKALSQQQNFTEKTKPGKVAETQQSIERLTKELGFLRAKQQDGTKNIPLAATLTIDFGKTSENLYAGMDEEYRHYQPAVLTWYHTALSAFNRGAEWHNMGGIENNLTGGLIQFKSKFNPFIQEYIGEFELPVNLFLYKASKFAYTMRKKLRRKH